MSGESFHAGWGLATALGLCLVAVRAAPPDPTPDSIASPSDVPRSTTDALALVDEVVAKGELDHDSSARLRRAFRQLDHDGRVAMLAAFHQAYSGEQIRVDDPTLFPF